MSQRALRGHVTAVEQSGPDRLAGMFPCPLEDLPEYISVVLLSKHRRRKIFQWKKERALESAKQKEKAVSSSSINKEQKNQIDEENEESSATTTSDAEGPCELSEDVKKKCLEELLLPMNEIDNIMLSLWLEIGEFSATHTCDANFLGITATITAEIPRAVVPLRVEEKYTDKQPSVFVLTSTNAKTKLQWEATCKKN